MIQFKFPVSGKTRTEHDLLGYKEVPEEALFGIQTLRCIENFNISNYHLCDYPEFIKAFGIVKMAAIKANHKLGLVSDEVCDAVVKACQELIDGKHLEFFPIDMMQGGAGTSMNMNANEVIANRALEIMGHKRGEYQYCHPNDHVNMAQSTNDAYPSAMHLGLYFINESVQASLKELIKAFDDKKKAFANIIKMGRTQLQDAVPMTLGQSFGAFADAMRHEASRLQRAADEFLYTNMGATAIGTGITAEPGYAKYCTEYLREISGLDIKLSRNLIEATHDGHQALTQPDRGHTRHILHGSLLFSPEVHRHQTVEDMQRPQTYVIRPPHRYRGDQAASQAARFVHHARQGQSCHPRGEGQSRHPRGSQPDLLQGYRQ